MIFRWPLTCVRNSLSYYAEVALKLFVAWAISLITILGVLSQGPLQLSKKSALQSTVVVSSNISGPTILSADLDHESNQDSDCQHSSSTFHTCHLGHCAFTIESSIQVEVLVPEQTLGFNIVSVMVYDFSTSPFRPPIS